MCTAFGWTNGEILSDALFLETFICRCLDTTGGILHNTYYMYVLLFCGEGLFSIKIEGAQSKSQNVFKLQKAQVQPINDE